MQFLDLPLQRPQILQTEVPALSMTAATNPDIAAEELLEGNYIVIEDFYPIGLKLLAALKKRIKTQFPKADFRQERAFRNAYHKASRRLLLEIQNNKIRVKKAPKIGWLDILYPDISDFVLTFPDIQGLNSAWQWYTKGIYIPVLKKKLHPFYNCYFPTRFEHLELFKSYLQNYKGKKDTAYDIGTGSGALIHILLNQSFKKIYATDNNPNAIAGIRNDIQHKRLPENLDLQYGDLFADFTEPADLIAFNPPWLPANQAIKDLDTAVYYPENILPRFFRQAQTRLAHSGKIMVLFSNLAQITNLSKNNPVEDALKKFPELYTEDFKTQKVQPGSEKTRRNLSHRRQEHVELWVIGKK